MQHNNTIINFENVPVRRGWGEKKKNWDFSVVGLVGVLTNSKTPRRYWSDLKIKLKQEGAQLYEKIVQLKFLAQDGKKYVSDAADTETMFRIIQSIPSPKAEPLKQWLAKVGYERLQETVNPEMAVNRARGHWLQVGRSTKWIEQRMRGQEIRNKLTDYWAGHEVTKEVEYAMLTDIIHKEWSGLTTKQHKKAKSLRGHNLRNNMTEAELIFTALEELSTRQIDESEKAKGYRENKVSARKGGKISGDARKKLELQTGKKVVSKENFLPPRKEIKTLT